MIAFFLLIELRCGAFRHVFVGYMAAIVVVSLVVGDYARVGAGSMIGEIIASVIGVSLWTKYFFASERVAAYLNYTPQNRRLDCGLACDEPASKREETLGEKLFGEGLVQDRERRKLNTGNVVSIVIAAAMAVAVVLAAVLFY